MTKSRKKTGIASSQIGAAGELLIQSRLLKRGIESARMTTDNGIDLVVYSRKRRDAVTVQVKTCLKPKPAGGRGKPSLDWWLRRNSPADLVALVDLDSEKIWIFTHVEFMKAAQQKPKGRAHLYFRVDKDADNRFWYAEHFTQYLLDARIEALFGKPK